MKEEESNEGGQKIESVSTASKLTEHIEDIKLENSCS